MDEERVYICGKCDMLFSSTRGRYSNEACPDCRHTATYLCTKSRWLCLGEGERASLIAEREPRTNASIAAKFESEPAAMQQGGDAQAPRPAASPHLLPRMTPATRSPSSSASPALCSSPSRGCR